MKPAGLFLRGFGLLSLAQNTWHLHQLRRIKKKIKKMSEFIMNSIEALLAALVAILLIFYSFYTKQWGNLESSALSLMLSAERLLTTVEDKKKMDWVYAAMWHRIPRW